MNGLGLPAAEPTVAELKARLALAEACEPIAQELQDAKAAYREALDGGDPVAIAAAKERKQAAAHHINETRTWLRREARIAYLTSCLGMPEGSRPDAEMRHAMRKELEQLEKDAAPLRELFGTPPAGQAPARPAPAVRPGDAVVDLPTVPVKARAMKGGK